MAWSSGRRAFNGDFLVKCEDFGANQRRHGVRSRVTGNDQHELRGIRRSRDIHHRVDLLKILLTNRRRHADDRGAGRRQRGRGVRHRQADATAYRIFIRKEHRRQALIDDGTLGSRQGIPISERTPAQQSQAKRVKVAASNRHVRDDRLRFARQRAPSVDRHLPGRSTREGDDAGERARRDVRNRVEPLLESPVRRRALFCRAVFRGGQRDWHGHDTCCVDDRIGAIDRKKAAHHQPSAGEQDQRQCHLDGQEHRRHAAPSMPLVEVLSPSFNERLAASFDA